MPEQIQHREYRAIGHFSAAEMRNLAPGPGDAIALGCPPGLFLSVLEKRAAFRAGIKPTPVTTVQVEKHGRLKSTITTTTEAARAAMKKRLDQSFQRVFNQDKEVAQLPSTLADQRQRENTREYIQLMKEGKI